MYRAVYERGGNCLPRWARRIDSGLRVYCGSRDHHKAAQTSRRIGRRRRLPGCDQRRGTKTVPDRRGAAQHPTADEDSHPSLGKLKLEDLIAHWILRRRDESGYIDNLAKTYPGK